MIALFRRTRMTQFPRTAAIAAALCALASPAMAQDTQLWTALFANRPDRARRGK